MQFPDWMTETLKIAGGVILLSNITLVLWLLLARGFRKWRFHSLKKGLINFLGLTEWYKSLSLKEQIQFKKYYNNVANVPSTVDRLTEADIYSASETPSQLLVMVAASSMMQEDFTFADKILLKANSEANSPWEKQQVLLAFSYLYFKQRDQLSGARENCASYSEKAIKNIERFGVSDDIPPTLPFDQLITLSTEENNFEKATEVAQKAINLFTPRYLEIAARFKKQKGVLKKKIQTG